MRLVMSNDSLEALSKREAAALATNHRRIVQATGDLHKRVQKRTMPGAFRQASVLGNYAEVFLLSTSPSVNGLGTPDTHFQVFFGLTAILAGKMALQRNCDL